MTHYTAKEIADHVRGELVGPGDLRVSGVAQLDGAGADQVTFVRDQKNLPAWESSASRVSLVSRRVKLEPDARRAVIRVQNPDAAMAVVLQLFAPPDIGPKPGIHASAVIDPDAKLGRDVAVGPGCILGPGAVIGDDCVLHANVCIMGASSLGAQCVLFPGVVVRERCEIGRRCIIHANAVIGSDGFGYTLAPGGGGLMKIPHIGGVRIDDDVEIGAGTCVDRGKFTPTIIGAGTKIDNLCQIAHNCRIGRMCLLAGQVGLAGSVTLGDGVRLGGSVGVKDQVTIGDRATIAACAAVMNDVPPGAVWGGYPAQDAKLALREIAAVRRLPDMIRELRKGQDTGEQNPVD